MPELDAPALAILWSVTKALIFLLGLVGSIAGSMVLGFRWLRSEILDTAATLTNPLAERLAVAEKALTALHSRMDHHFGERPP